jgi:hypothetical protein
MTVDERELNVFAKADDATRKAILDGAKDEQQRAMLESVLNSPAWKMSELVVEIDRVTRENRSLQSLAVEAETASRERDRAVEQRDAAEKARKAAERVADREKHERINTEDELQNLKKRIAELQSKSSRIDLLHEEVNS